MNILDKIVAQKEQEAAALPRAQEGAGVRPDRRDFLAALQRPKRGGVALIAEVKKASPSAGVICADFDPVRIARAYEAGGAACLSVLTDQQFFQGSLEYLRAIRSAVSLPLLRKDFMISDRQIFESVHAGADAILLIVRILDDARLKDFHALATSLGLAALVEVHDDAELDRALAMGAKLIGVNNRNLDTFVVDLATTERLAARVPADVLLVAESGIHARADVARVQAAGARAILVGESLMKNPAQIGEKINALLPSA
ncbi:MAG TPA: indole-3-glycerol phosphate synthase TrpC [Verrucomicrobiae bacterium]|nr:indole-3-glycerol phosphate synthase TrpC [Verrucomicrobiae bacterium]